MFKLFIALLGVVGLFLGAAYWAGIPPWALKDSLGMGTGLGAKLACSARFISGFDPALIRADLASYTPAAHLVDIDYDETAQTTTASIFGLGITRATYRSGLGCTLDRGDTAHLGNISVPSTTAQTGTWPMGDTVAPQASAQQALTAQLESDNRQGFQTRALVWIKNGALIGEAYAPGIQTDTPLLGWSMGKSLTGIVIGHLAYTGALKLDAPHLFAEWAEDARTNITVKQLLQMTSGLAFSEIYGPGSDATHMLFTARSSAAVALKQPLDHIPGSHFAYASGTTNLLMALFVKRSGGLQEAVHTLRHNVLAPLGMRHTIIEPDPAGTFVGSSYVYATARDWARLGQLLLNNGSLNGNRIIAPEWVAQAQTPNGSANDSRYGYQLWLNGTAADKRWPDLPEDAFAMLGNRSQVVMIVPSANSVLVRLGWSSTPYPTSRHLAAILATPLP